MLFSVYPNDTFSYWIVKFATVIKLKIPYLAVLSDLNKRDV